MDYRLWTIDYGLSKILFIILTAVATLTGCSRGATVAEPPGQLLSQQQMVSFLIDLHLAEAKMNYAEVRQSDSTEILFRNYEKHLMNQHGFTDSVYLESYTYYLDNMELMNEIYDDVVDSLNVMSTLEKAKQDEQSEETL
ncbi:MAG: DUF4296 domain-containing protein [Tunicatimonas sp.]